MAYSEAHSYLHRRYIRPRFNFFFLHCEELPLEPWFGAITLTQNSPSFGVKFSLRDIGRIFFPTKIRNIKLWEIPKLFNFRIPEG